MGSQSWCPRKRMTARQMTIISLFGPARPALFKPHTLLVLLNTVCCLAFPDGFTSPGSFKSSLTNIFMSLSTSGYDVDQACTGCATTFNFFFFYYFIVLLFTVCSLSFWVLFIN